MTDSSLGPAETPQDDDRGSALIFHDLPGLPALLAHAAVPMAILDERLNIRYANEPLIEQLHLGDPPAWHKLRLISDRHRQAFERAMRDALAGNAPRLPEMRLQTPSGTIVHLDGRLFRTTDRRGRQVVVVLLNDVSDIVSVRESCTDLNQLVVAAELVGVIAHELNNHLAAVLGFSQLMSRNSTSAEAAEDLGRILESVGLCQHLVSRLLTQAKGCRPSRIEVCLNELIEKVLASFTAKLESTGVRCRLCLDPELPLIRAAAQQLEAVVASIIDNAYHAMPDGGILTIQTMTAPPDAQPPAGEAPCSADRFVDIRFTDTGCGIASEILPGIFEPFVTTRGETAAGVGLTISRSIIDKHGGTIRVAQTSPAGAAFVVSLPAGEPPSPGADLSAAHTSRPKARKVLIIDDDPGCCSIVALILTREGHTVETASDGREAFQRLQEQHYDVIIADMRMPHMDGRKLYEDLHRKDPILAGRIVFVTGDTLSTDTENFLRGVPNPHVMKPFNIEQITSIVREL